MYGLVEEIKKGTLTEYKTYFSSTGGLFGWNMDQRVY